MVTNKLLRDLIVELPRSDFSGANNQAVLIEMEG